MKEIIRTGSFRVADTIYSFAIIFFIKISFILYTEDVFIYFRVVPVPMEIVVFPRYQSDFTFAISIEYIGFQIHAHIDSTSTIRAIKCALLRDFISRSRSHRAEHCNGLLRSGFPAVFLAIYALYSEERKNSIFRWRIMKLENAGCSAKRALNQRSNSIFLSLSPFLHLMNVKIISLLRLKSAI